MFKLLAYILSRNKVSDPQDNRKQLFFIKYDGVSTIALLNYCLGIQYPNSLIVNRPSTLHSSEATWQSLLNSTATRSLQNYSSPSKVHWNLSELIVLKFTLLEVISGRV